MPNDLKALHEFTYWKKVLKNSWLDKSSYSTQNEDSSTKQITPGVPSRVVWQGVIERSSVFRFWRSYQKRVRNHHKNWSFIIAEQ
jgi:hypothetical protein